MAIDFGRMFRNVATGYLSAKIANTEANDKLNARIIEAAGLKYHNETVPEFEKNEKNRASAYNQLAKILESEEAADYLDANGFIIGDGKDVERNLKLLEDKNIKADAFKNYIPTTNYSDRYKVRAASIEERGAQIHKDLGMRQGGIGPSVIEGLVTKPMDADISTTVTIPAVEPQQIEGTPIMTRGTPETSEIQTVKRYTADTPMSELFTTIPESEGKMEPQFRLRMNDAVRVSLDSMGLSGKYKVGLDGNLDVTNFDEADNAKYGYASELINNEFLQPNFDTRTYQLVGSNVGTYIENYERDIVNAHNTYSTALYNSPASTQPQGDAAYKIFLDTPEMATLLMRYARGSRAERKLIEAKFGKSYSYSEFFAKYLDELAPE